MNDSTRKVWLVCYDITSPARLRRVYRILRGHGDHLQYSVFRCEVSDRQRKALEGELIEVIDPTADQVLFVPLGKPDASHDKSVYTLGVPLTHIERVCHVV